jgi:GDP-L-fucose synthase
MPMKKDSRIYVAGHTGLVGSAITGALLKEGFSGLILRTLDELDLSNQSQVEAFFRSEKPEYVFLAAAKVGGIVANNTYRADFIYENLQIESNVIHCSWKYGVKKLLFLGSTCIYPKEAPQPLKESSLLASSLEYTNEPYAIAKIAGLKMCESYNIQYGTDFIAVMPTNLYGPSDNYDLEKSHVLPALIRKFHLGHCLEMDNWDAIRKDLGKNPIEGINGKSGKEEIREVLSRFGIRLSYPLSVERREESVEKGEDYEGQPETLNFKPVTISLWGTGKPLREFMYSQDLAGACVFIMQNITSSQIQAAHKKLNPSDPHPPHFLNIGTGVEITIKDLALKIRDITGFKGLIEFDSSKPDGTFRKVTDTTVLKSLGFTPKTDLDEGLRMVYEQYIRCQQ